MILNKKITCDQDDSLYYFLIEIICLSRSSRGEYFSASNARPAIFGYAETHYCFLITTKNSKKMRLENENTNIHTQ
jgi:hypothetical protein